MVFFTSDTTAPSPADPHNSGTVPPKTYRSGTLAYTKYGLAVLFAWLLWGDFCVVFMDRVAPLILPLKLKDLGASNTLMSIIMTTLPAIMTMTVCPWVSFKSDRHRGPNGRRLPFIRSTLPFLTISLLMLGWSESISAQLQRVIPPLMSVSPATVTIVMIAVFYIAFKFFDIFVGAVFAYLFNDVVPPQFFGRFMGMMRIISGVVINGYNFFF